MQSRLRILALRGNSPAEGELFRLLQSEVLLTSAWNAQELETLLKGGAYDLFLCTLPVGSPDLQAAFRSVRQICPRMAAISYRAELHQVHIVQAGNTGLTPQKLKSNPVLAIMARLGVRADEVW